MAIFALFFDVRYPPSTTLVRKCASQAMSFGASLNILVDVSRTRAERWYWPDVLHGNSKADTSVIVDGALAEAKTILESYGVEYHIQKVDTSDYASGLNTHINPKKTHALVIPSKLLHSHHPIKRELTSIAAPILVVTEKEWHKPLRIGVGVDPLHLNARDLDFDRKLLRIVTRWASSSKGNFSLLHSCYIPPLAIGAKMKIHAIHKEEVLALARGSELSEDDIHLLTGFPEDTIPNWISKAGLDILVMGSFSRSHKKSKWLGSTCSALIDTMPCDLLLIGPQL